MADKRTALEKASDDFARKRLLDDGLVPVVIDGKVWWVLPTAAKEAK